MDFRDSAQELLALLDKAVKKNVSGRETALAFSGGLDSTLLAKLASKYTSVRAYAVGVEGAYDLANAEKSARSIGVPLEKIIASREDVAHASEEARKIVPDPSILDIQIAVPLHLLCSNVHKKGITELLIGQGADELFGGYARYEKMGETQLQNALRTDYEALPSMLERRDCAVAKYNKVTLKTPYLEKEVADFALALPLEFKVNNGKKIILREAARLSGLPPEICAQPKKAIQYGSGVSKALGY